MTWDLLPLLALVVAVGIDLPLVLLLLLLLAHLPPGMELPPEWLALASPGPALLGAVLYLSGWGIRRVPGLHWGWEALLAVASLPAAALVVTLFQPGDPTFPALLLPLLAVGVAASLQGGRLGARVLDRLLVRRPGAPDPLQRELGEDLAVVTLLALTLHLPRFAGPAALVLLVTFAWQGRPSLRAARFLPTLLGGIFRYLTRPGSGWAGPGDLPRWVASGGAQPPLRGEPDGSGERGLEGTIPSGIRGTRAALVGPREVGLFRPGWLVWDGASSLFVYRTPSRSWELEVAARPSPEAPPEPPPWGRLVWVAAGEEGGGVLLIPLDGPPNVEARL